MFVHIGDGFCIRDKDLVGIFDLEVTTTMKTSADFLSKAGESGQAESVINRGEMPKSFIVARTHVGDKEVNKVYISPLATQTLKHRFELHS